VESLEIPVMAPEPCACGPGNGINTLRFEPRRCINCGRCTEVCPHGVFGRGEKTIELANENDCMECGACALNCPTKAIAVESGVGCAAAMMKAAILGKDEVVCGEDCCE